jgi:methionine-rich copper-binding protein CopC
MKKLIGLLAAGSLILSSAVFAHTGLSSSAPASNAMLMTTPTQLDLEFGSEVRLVKLYLRNSKAEHIKVDFKPSTEANTKFSYAIPTLATGNYRVDWMIMGGDAHKVTGYYTFMLHDMNMDMNANTNASTSHNDGHNGPSQ